MPKYDETIWLKVNWGKKPPTPIREVISKEDKLGLDGVYITLEVGDQIEIRKNDIVSIDKYNLYVEKVMS